MYVHADGEGVALFYALTRRGYIDLPEPADDDELVQWAHELKAHPPRRQLVAAPAK
jgi:hypothetical protein